MENTSSAGFRMRTLNNPMRNKSQNLKRPLNNVGANLSTARKQQ